MNCSPCTSCNRHVDVAASTCPFCASVLSPTRPRHGLLSGAVFAAAALATGACDQGKKAEAPTVGSAAAPGDASVPDAPTDAPEAIRHEVVPPYGAPSARRRIV